MMLKKMKKMRAVMMEYVIIAVMIAAAVVVAVMMFGDTIKGEFGVAATAMTDPSSAAQAHSDQKNTTQTNKQAAENSASQFHGSGLNNGNGNNNNNNRW